MRQEMNVKAKDTLERMKTAVMGHLVLCIRSLFFLGCTIKKIQGIQLERVKARAKMHEMTYSQPS